MPNLATTNVLLGIMAAVSILEVLAVVGMVVFGWAVYRRVKELATGLHARNMAPVVERVHAIFDDVKAVSATVRTETERVDYAMRRTINRVDGTTRRVQESARVRGCRLLGLARGLVTAMQHFAHLYERATAERTERRFDTIQ
jgi:hypothetical protein